MNYRLVSILLLCLTIHTGCSLYSSAGRKQFEELSPTAVQNTEVGVSKTTTLKNCWIQEKDRALDLLHPDFKYSVQMINNNEIEVCLEDSNS